MPSDFSRQFASHLNDIRLERGVTQTAIAKLLGKSQSVISEHVTGVRAPDTDLIDAIAYLGGLTSMELVTVIQDRMRALARPAGAAPGTASPDGDGSPHPTSLAPGDTNAAPSRAHGQSVRHRGGRSR